MGQFNLKDIVSIVADVIELELGFPDQVFRSQFKGYLFCDNGWFFCSPFLDAVKAILNFESEEIAWFVELDPVHLDRAIRNFMPIHRHNSTGDFREMINSNKFGTENDIFIPYKYICFSSSRKWCFYCETHADVGVFAAVNEDYYDHNSSALSKLWLAPVGELLAGGSMALEPFTSAYFEWTESLSKNYPPLLPLNKIRLPNPSV